MPSSLLPRRATTPRSEACGGRLPLGSLVLREQLERAAALEVLREELGRARVVELQVGDRLDEPRAA